MISLTRLSGSVFALNPDLVERVDRTPDTVITLVDGKKYVVAEPLEVVVATIRQDRAETIALSGQIQVGQLLVPRDPDDPEQGPGDLPATGILAQLLEQHHRRPSLSLVDGQEVSPR